MKTKNISNMVVASLMLLTVLSCSKYEDGPWISFRSPVKRLAGNTYKIESFVTNGIDNTTLWKDSFDWKYTFGTNNDIESPSVLYITSEISDPKNGNGAWMFLSPHTHAFDYQYIWLSYWFGSLDSASVGIAPLKSNEPVYFYVTKLSSSKLWLEYTDSVGNFYNIKLYSE